jgi:hypothetical protein
MSTDGAATMALPAPGDEAFAVGAEVGPYRIEASLGEGGMGVVLRASHRLLGRPAALKAMRAEIAADRQYVERFLREARTAASVTHQNLVAIHDAGELGGRLYLVFEYVSGGDLDALLARRGPLPPTEALALIAACADGLQALHEAGLVHRDIKPHNIFLDARGRPKLGDFGLARGADGADRVTMTGIGMGTPAYMAPEQANGDPGVDVRADIHALGGTLFTLLTKRTPFVGATSWAVVNAVVNDPPPDPRSVRPDLPAELSALVARAMAKRREDRFQTPAELAVACRAALARLDGSANAAVAPQLELPGGPFLGPFSGGGALWLSAVAAALLLLPLGLAPLCGLRAGWIAPGYGQPALWGQWLGFVAAAAALLWQPMRLARGERVGRGGQLAATLLNAVVLAIFVWCAWTALLDAAGASRSWKPPAAITTTLVGVAWLGWWARASWSSEGPVLAAQFTRLAQATIPLLLATLIGHLIAAGGGPQPVDSWSTRLSPRYDDAEAASALALALPLALGVAAALLRLRWSRR